MTKNNKQSLFFFGALAQNIMYAFQGFVFYYAYMQGYTVCAIVQFVVFSLTTFEQAKMDFNNFYQNRDLLQYVQSLEKKLSDKLRESE